jgi:hypothetical protein
MHVQRGPSLVHQNSENNPPISAHMNEPCTMRVEGQLGQVSACLDDPGRFYGRGKMDQDTKLLVEGIFDEPSSHT